MVVATIVLIVVLFELSIPFENKDKQQTAEDEGAAAQYSSTVLGKTNKIKVLYLFFFFIILFCCVDM